MPATPIPVETPVAVPVGTVVEPHADPVDAGVDVHVDNLVSTLDATSADDMTAGGTATGTAAYLLTTWAATASVVAGNVRRTAGGLVVHYKGAGTTGASAPAAAGTGTDGSALYAAYAGTNFGGCLVEDTDGSNALFTGPGSQITAGGDLSGTFVPAQGGMTWPRGTDVTNLYAITGGSSVAYTVALTL
jgi:hypothetical protein